MSQNWFSSTSGNTLLGSDRNAHDLRVAGRITLHMAYLLCKAVMGRRAIDVIEVTAYDMRCMMQEGLHCL